MIVATCWICVNPYNFETCCPFGSCVPNFGAALPCGEYTTASSRGKKIPTKPLFYLFFLLALLVRRFKTRVVAALMKKLIKTMAVMLLTTLSASLAAAPFGYSINADSGSNNADSLYLIDLATGDETLRH